MSDLYKALLIDIGNTRIKYALVNTMTDTDDISNCEKPIQLEQYIAKAEQIIVASVGNPDYILQIQTLCHQHSKSCRVIHTEAEKFGVSCAYENFKTLGVDRWLAVLAAHEITNLPVAILDLGTANTCDILINNQHIGGWIAPGFSLMRESLLKNTQQVFADDKKATDLAVGNTTQDCVNYGCLASQIGFVSMAEQYLSEKFDDYKIFITGGAQKSLNSKRNSKIILYPNLVVKSLYKFI